MLFIFLLIVGLIVFFAILRYFKNKEKWDNSSYAKQTHREYGQVSRWDGSRGESELYRYLRPLEESGYKLLFNLYLPLPNGKTTELDVVVIGPYNIIVIESKDYGGWIFGSENNDKWTVTYRSGRNGSTKRQFYNPVKQNMSHCNALSRILENSVPEKTPICSLVAFSDRCVFKDVYVTNNAIVTHYSQVAQIASNLLNYNIGVSLNAEMVYNRLYPYTQTPESIKQQHIADIQYGSFH